MLKVSYYRDGKSYFRTASIKLSPPSNLMYTQVCNGEVNGLDVYLDKVWVSCPIHHDDDEDDGEYRKPVVVWPITLTNNGTDKWLNDWTTDDYNYEYERDETDGEESENDKLLKDLYKCVKCEVDTHWDCYCKTQKVCGCGCDKLHDGW